MQWMAFNLFGGWLGILGGAVSGGLIGLFFHRDSWMGGYGSFRRRMLRLGHIAFFGMGFVNVLAAVTTRGLDFRPADLKIASVGLIIGLVGMPLCCFLAAWRKPMRHLFPIPVLGVLAGAVSLLLGWP